jgi:beta-lactamase class A
MHSIKSFFNYRIPLSLNLVFIAGVLLLVFFNLSLKKKTADIPISTITANTTSEEPPLTIVRKRNFRFIQPLIATESSKESAKLAPLKNTVQHMIDQYRQQGLLSNASVYFMDLNSNNWFAVNGSEKYTPGSLIKVPVIMSYLKESEQKTGWLDSKIYFDPALKGIPHQTYEAEPLVPGNSYLIRDLLRRTAIMSDNESTALINFYINRTLFSKMFADLNLVVPDLQDKSYQTSVLEYSRFFQVLFNSSWLNETNSEMALQWLSESTFREGMTKYLPANVVVPRKFGEYGVTSDKQWHESGIVYFDHKPYLLTIMTRGFDNEKLRLVISELSKTIYESYHKAS